MKRPAQGPTTRQAQYLAFIRAFTQRWGIPPSFEDIGRHFMTTPPSVNSMIKTLEARGFLARIPGAARSLRVLLPEEALTEPVREARSPERGGRDPRLESAIEMACLVVERLVPALKTADREVLWAALDSVDSALQVACKAGGASADRAREAQATLIKVAHAAQGISPDIGPSRRARWSR